MAHWLTDEPSLTEEPVRKSKPFSKREIKHIKGPKNEKVGTQCVHYDAIYQHVLWSRVLTSKLGGHDSSLGRTSIQDRKIVH